VLRGGDRFLYVQSFATDMASLPTNRATVRGSRLSPLFAPAAAPALVPVPASAPGFQGCKALDPKGLDPLLGIPTVITDESPRDLAVKIVDSEGEIRFFDAEKLGENAGKFRKSAEIYDADAAKVQRWLMHGGAKTILRSGDDAFELRTKKDRLPFSPWFPGITEFVGPIKPGYTIEARTRPALIPYSPWQPDFVGPVKVQYVDDFEAVEHLQPKFRTVLCADRLVPGTSAEVWQSQKTGQASWHNLTVCGSPWSCPICAERISKGRQEQIKKVYEAAKSHAVNGSVYMLTFTVRHGLGDDCAVLVGKMKHAMQLLQKTIAWKGCTRREALKRPKADSMPFLDYIGRIAALEATHGANGWHPHEHHLWFFKKKLCSSEVKALKTRLFEAWAECCVKAGMRAPLAEFGLDVRAALSAAEYLAKFADLGHERRWGPEKELASSHSKRASMGGRSPMKILWDACTSGNLEDFDPAQPMTVMNRDAYLFRDFSAAFLGKHQLQLSRTLKTWLRSMGVDLDETEAGDLELAAALESDSRPVMEFSNEDFRVIVRNKAHCEVLSIYKAEGPDAAFAFVASLPGRIYHDDDLQWSNLNPAHAPGEKRKSVFEAESPEHLFPLTDTYSTDEWLVGADLEYWAATRRDDEFAFFADKPD